MQQARSILDQSIIGAPGAVTPFRGVDFTGLQATVQGQKIMGIAKHGAALGQNFDVAVIGTCLVEAGAAFNPGQALIMDNQGRAIPNTGALAVKAGATAVTSAAANGAILQGSDLPEYVFADAVGQAVNVGDIVEVLLRRA